MLTESEIRALSPEDYGKLCHIHYVLEDAPEGGAYIICFECNHVYPTAEALEREWIECWPEGAARPAAEIHSCPHCIHDF